MSNGDSVFSFIRGAAAPAQPAGPAPQAAPAPAPRVPDALAVKIAGIEAKLAELESSGRASAEGLQSELQRSQLKVSALQLTIAELKKAVRETESEKLAETEAAGKALEQFRGDLAVLRYRTDAAEELCRGLSLANLDGKLSDRVLEKLEAGALSGLKDRFTALDAAFEEVTRRAALASETATGGARRLDKLEERAAHFSVLEGRFEANERKFERLYELEACVQAMKVNAESVGNKLASLVRDTAGISAEHENFRSDFESVSHQVKQLTALFGYFRTELSFLLPGKRESAAGERRD